MGSKIETKKSETKGAKASSISSVFKQIMDLCVSAQRDAEDFWGEKANNAAGKRVRGALQEMIKLSKEERKNIQEVKNERRGKETKGSTKEKTAAKPTEEAKTDKKKKSK